MSDYSIFPNALDGYEQLPLAIDGVTEVNAASVNRLRSAIINIENHIGIGASGVYSTIADRINDVDSFDSNIESHLDNELNPHGTSFLTLVGGTFEDLNSLISDEDLVSYSNFIIHTNNSSNPHNTSITNLKSGTLSELNSIITDATLDDITGTRVPKSHASSHEYGGSDEINGNQIAISYSPTNYSVNNEILLEHLSALDNILLVNQDSLEASANKFLTKLDSIKFHLSLITGVELPERENVFENLDDIILLFSLMTE